MMIQSLAINSIQYVTESSALILIFASFLAGFVIGIWYQRITGK